MSLIFLPNSLFVELIAKKSKEVSVCTRLSLVSFSDKAIEAPNGVKGSMEATDEGFDFSSSLPKNCSNNKTREVLSEKAVAWSHGIDELTQICLDELSYCMIVS